MKYIFILSFAILFSSCSSTPSKNELQEHSKTFNAPFETVWRATHQALLNYPMNLNNMDTGHLQTLYITGKHRYKAPHQKKKLLASGYQYRINVHIVRNGEKQSKVLIHKEVRVLKDFFSEPIDSISDGYEEMSLLYRIKREIIIEKKLQKLIDKKKKEAAAKGGKTQSPPQKVNF